jgi:hypothetical protein
MNSSYTPGGVKAFYPSKKTHAGVLLFMALFLCLCFSSYAQMYVTTTAAARGGNAYPWATTFANKVELDYQPGDFTSTPNSGLIKKLYFRFTSVNSTTYSNLLIQMGQTSSALTGSTYSTNVTTVYSASSVTISPTKGSWYVITLNTPFKYDSSKNLEVIISHTGFSGSGNIVSDFSSSTSYTVFRHRVYGATGNSTGQGSDGELYDLGFDVGPDCKSIAAAGSDQTINYGSSATIGAAAISGSTYSWVSSPAGFTSTDANPTVSPTTTTIYTVTEINASGCTNSNSATVTVNPPAGALNFNGSNYVSLNSSLTNFGTGDFTIQANLRFTSAAGMYFLSKRGFCGGDNFISMQMYQGKIGMETHDNVNYTGFSGNTAINDGKWHQVTAVRKSGTLYLYIDGSLDASAASTSNLNSTYTLNLGTSVCVGQNGNSNYSGDMDEVRIWNRALCQAELSNNKTCELSGTQTGLQAYYKFNQGFIGTDNTSETSLTDATGNGNTGTLHGFTLKGSSSNWIGGITTSCSAFSNPIISLAGNGTAITNGST